MKLLVVVLNFRQTDLTIDCLRSLESRHGGVPGTQVVVVGNGSGGGAPEKLRRAIEEHGWGSWASLLVSPTNLGFTGGNNLAIRRALSGDDRPELVLLLNSDTVVLDGALEALKTFMDAHPRVGVAGSQLLSPEGEVRASPFRFHSALGEFERGLRVEAVTRLLSRFRAPIFPVPTVAVAADWVSGASMILRASMLDQIGLLDEGLFTYFDDVDLCLRARRAGWEVWFVPESRIVHYEGASSGVTATSPRRWPAFYFQARRRFFLKNYGPVRAALVDAAFLVAFSSWRARRWATGCPDPDPPHLLADSIRHSVFVAGFSVDDVQPPTPEGGPRP